MDDGCAALTHIIHNFLWNRFGCCLTIFRYDWFEFSEGYNFFDLFQNFQVFAVSDEDAIIALREFSNEQLLGHIIEFVRGATFERSLFGLRHTRRVDIQLHAQERDDVSFMKFKARRHSTPANHELSEIGTFSDLKETNGLIIEDFVALGSLGAEVIVPKCPEVSC